MTRAIKVEACTYCDDTYCAVRIPDMGYPIPNSCPLPPWPSISENYLHDKAIQIFNDSNLGQMHILYLLREMIKSIGVEVRDEKP